MVATPIGITAIAVTIKAADATSAAPYTVVTWTDSALKVHTVNIDHNSDAGGLILALAKAFQTAVIV